MEFAVWVWGTEVLISAEGGVQREEGAQVHRGDDGRGCASQLRCQVGCWPDPRRAGGRKGRLNLYVFAERLLSGWFPGNSREFLC